MAFVFQQNKKNWEYIDVYKRQLPDKAIDLIDEAASRVKMRTYTRPENLKELEDKILEYEKEKDEDVYKRQPQDWLLN